MKKRTKRKPRILFWVLHDGKVYYREWTGIGPRGTRSLKHAQRFITKKEAMHSPAYSFAYQFYEPLAIRKGSIGASLLEAAS